MQSVKRDCCSRLMRMYLYCINNPLFFVNMDQTAVYLNCPPKRTVDGKGKKIISIRVRGTASMRFTLCIAVAMDGTKLPLFVICKGKPNGNVEKNLSGILPAGVFGCTQSKARYDERAMHKWYDAIWLPFIAGHDGESGLLLNDCKVHKMGSVHNRMISDRTNRFLIPAHDTSVLQPCDVSINKPLKEILKKAASDWRRDDYGIQTSVTKTP